MSKPWMVTCSNCGGVVTSVNETIVDLQILSVDDTPKSEESDTAERSAYILYNMVDLNKNGKLDCKELQSALSVGGLQFSLPTVNILLAKHDRNRNGQLEFDEFKSLLDEVWRWKEAFDYFDIDKSGSIDFGELQQALIMIGINLSPTTYQTVFFSSDTDRSGSISMDEFIKLVTELQLSQIRYMELDKDESGKVNLSYDKFVDLIFSIRS